MNVSAYLSNYCFVLFIHKFCFLEQSLPDTSFSMKNTKDHLTWSNKTQLFFWEILFSQAQFHHSRDSLYSLIDICFSVHQFYWINYSHHQSILSTIIQIPTQFSFSHFHDFPRLFSSFLVFFYGRTSSLVILFVFCFPFFPKYTRYSIFSVHSYRKHTPSQAHPSALENPWSYSRNKASNCTNVGFWWISFSFSACLSVWCSFSAKTRGTCALQSICTFPFLFPHNLAITLRLACGCPAISTHSTSPALPSTGTASS